MSIPPMGSFSSECSHTKKDLGKEVMVEGNDQMKETKAETVKQQVYEQKNIDRVSDTDWTPTPTDGGNDDGPQGEESGSIQQNLASGISGLPGQDNPGSSHQNGLFKQILSGLHDEGNEGSQFNLLFQLNELLSFGNVDSLRDFSVNSFVPLLVEFLNFVHNPDMMLLAARALTHLCDLLPASCAAVVHYGAIPRFCACILTIEYIDLAEQALQALEKISHEEPAACLRAGALMAVLFNLDFFSTSLQRVAVSTAANICKGLRSDASDCVIEAIPTLTNVLQYQDSKTVDYASVCLMQIVETFASVPEKFDILCSEGLISQVAFVISLGNATGKSLDSQTSFSTSTQTRLMRVLSMCASGSAAAAETLVLLGISDILKESLAENVLASKTILPPALLYEIVVLINELLPPMPKSTAPPISNNAMGESEIGSEKDYAAMASIDSGAARQGALEETGVREKLFFHQPDLLVQFGVDLFPSLVQVYGSSENLAIQKKCLACIHKLLRFSGPGFLGTLLVEGIISSFLVGVLASKNASILIIALQIAEILMQIDQDLFAKAFIKEGLLHAIDELIASFKPLRSGRRARAVETAKYIKEKYFSCCFGHPDEGIKETLWTLKELCAKLDSESAQGTKYFNQDVMAASMSEILKELGSEGGLSAFEFKESGIVSSVLSYLGVGSVQPGTSILRQEAPQRFKQFIELSLPLNSNGIEIPLITLVRKLQNALASAERFPALLEGANDGNCALRDDESSQSSEEFEEHFTDWGDAFVNEYDEDYDEDRGLNDISERQGHFTDEGDPDVDEYSGDYDEDGGLNESSAELEEHFTEEGDADASVDEYYREDRGKKAIPNEDSEDNFGDSFGDDGADHDEHRVKNVTSNEDPEANFGDSSVEDGTDDDHYDHDSSVEADSDWTGPRVPDISLGDGEDIETAGIELISQPSCFTGPTTASGKQTGANNAFWPDGSWHVERIVESISEMKLPRGSEKEDYTYHILVLLRILEHLNRLAPRLRAQYSDDSFAESGNLDNLIAWQLLVPVVPSEEFLSSKLTSKLTSQMDHALEFCSGHLPTWCHQLIKACPFLFPFETRMKYFLSTAFGPSRAFQWFHQNRDRSAQNRGATHRVRRLRRQKVRVSRHNILDSAAKVMELYSGQNAVIQVEYFGEVGTGLGPTLEFYTLVSHELQQSSLDMWRTDSSRDDARGVELAIADGGDRGSKSDYALGINYACAPQGLFPRPWLPGGKTVSDGKYAKVVEHFRLLGRLMAKALQDGRMLDLPLSSAFYKLILGKKLDSHDIGSIDSELGRTLREMQVLARRKRFLESSGSDSRQAIEALRFRDSRIEDLFLDFTLPGYPDYSLKPGGSEEMVDLENLEEYVSLVVDATLNKGIIEQLEAFFSGFNQVFKLSTLQIFAEDELESLLCGRLEQWKPETLPELLNFDHGYTASSPPIRHLLEVMVEFTPFEQQEFLRFVTGAPKLPLGGLSVLSPKLTVVRKQPLGVTGAGAATLGSAPPTTASSCETSVADQDLPSVMTCANYLKLPPYSCKEVMQKRLMFAIREGQGSFDLS